MIQLEIEHGVPIPPPKRGKNAIFPKDLPVNPKVRYPDRSKMEIGDSFFVPGMPKLIWQRARSAIKSRFPHVVRAYYGPEEWGVRVWRTG